MDKCKPCNLTKLFDICRGCRWDLMEKFVKEKKDPPLDDGLAGACSGGHLDLALEMIRRGATDIQRAIDEATKKEHMWIVSKLPPPKKHVECYYCGCNLPWTWDDAICFNICRSCWSHKNKHRSTIAYPYENDPKIDPKKIDSCDMSEIECPYMSKDNTSADEICNGLFLGNIYSCTEKWLTEHAITLSICVFCSEEAHSVPKHIRSIHINVRDDYNEPIAIHFKYVSQSITNELKRGGRVLVHCWAGQSRSATLVLAWLISRGYSYKDAFALVRSKRPQIGPNGGFKIKLQTWEKS